MIISFEPALPCTQVMPDGNLCGALANDGMVTPGDEDFWEFLPLCRAHIQERQSRDEAWTTPQNPPIDERTSDANGDRTPK